MGWNSHPFGNFVHCSASHPTYFGMFGTSTGNVCVQFPNSRTSVVNRNIGISVTSGQKAMSVIAQVGGFGTMSMLYGIFRLWNNSPDSEHFVPYNHGIQGDTQHSMSTNQRIGKWWIRVPTLPDKLVLGLILPRN